jgi:uncharacterized protein DUF1775
MVVVVLAYATAAEAHVTVAPSFVEADTPTTVSFETPNERRGHATTSLEIDVPAGIELTESDPPNGWTLDLREDRARWTGGRIRAADVVSFPLVVTARTDPGPVTFNAKQRYDDGEVVSWDAQLTVLPGATESSPPQHVRRALIASVVGLGVIGASFLALSRLRRRSLQDR